MRKVLAILTVILMMVMVFPASALTEEAVEEPQEVQEIVIPDKLTVHIVGFIKAGKLVTGASMDLVKGQSKLISVFINKVGGKNHRSENNGEMHTFLNGFVFTDENGSIMTTTENVYSGETIAKIIANDYINNGIGDIYIAPVYHVVKNWYLDYIYIDNISTGSRSFPFLYSSMTLKGYIIKDEI